MFHLWNLWKKSLRIQIASSFSVLSLTIVALVGALAFVQARATLKQSVFNRLETASSLKEADLGRWLNDRRNTVRSLNQLTEVNTQAEILLTEDRSSDDYIAAQQNLQRLLGDFIQDNPGYQEFFVVSKGGRVLASTRPENVSWYATLNEYSDISERSESGKFNANVYQSALTERPTITLTVPIQNSQGKQLGMLAVNLNLDSMDEIIRANSGLGNTSETYLVADLGSNFFTTNVFVSSERFGSEEFPDGINSPGIEAAMLGNGGIGLYPNYRGVPVIGVYRWLPEQDMALIVEMAQAEAFAPAKRLSRSIFLVGLVLAALMTAGILVLSYRVVSPIVNIAETARAVRASLKQGQVAELETVEIATDNEIGTLAETFNQLVEQLGRSYAELHEKNKDLQLTLTDLKQTQTQLIQTEKMSSLGQMVAGIAHEINNPISFIQGNIGPLKGYFEDLIDLLDAYQSEYPNPSEALIEKQEEADLEFLLEDAKKLLGSLKMGTERVRDIVVSLRNYSRLDEAAIKDVNLNEGIDSTLLILNHRIKHGIDVVKNYGNLPSVRCSPAQLNQVFTNIVANALDAMFDADSQTKQLAIVTRRLDATQVQISIRDTGPGMTPEVKAKIFDPFFTT
ncbi:MAG: cache domain-containing protein, partial [Cyanobacteria bacterium P01_D01_bin.14]